MYVRRGAEHAVRKALKVIGIGSLAAGTLLTSCSEGGVSEKTAQLEGYEIEIDAGTDVFNATTNAVDCGTVQETVTLGADSAREYYPPLRRSDELKWYQVNTDAIELQDWNICFGQVVVPAADVEVVPGN